MKNQEILDFLVNLSIPALAQTATDAESSYIDYLEQCLKAEQQSRQQRTRSVLLKMAAFPAVKQLHAYDFNFAVGAPKKQIEALALICPLNLVPVAKLDYCKA